MEHGKILFSSEDGGDFDSGGQYGVGYDFAVGIGLILVPKVEHGLGHLLIVGGGELLNLGLPHHPRGGAFGVFGKDLFADFGGQRRRMYQVAF